MKLTIAHSKAREDNFMLANKTTSYYVGNFNEICQLSLFQVYKEL